MAQFLKAYEIGSAELKVFVLANAERVKAHAQAMAEKDGLPFQYLSTSLRKVDAARKLAERHGVEERLVCVFSVLEPCRTFSLPLSTRSGPRSLGQVPSACTGATTSWIASWASSTCACRPGALQMQVCLNGYKRPARKLPARGIRCTKLEDAFARTRDLPQAHRSVSRLSLLNWPRLLNRYASRFVPQLGNVLYGRRYP